jgi:hypothetical protein
VPESATTCWSVGGRAAGRSMEMVDYLGGVAGTVGRVTRAL